MGGIRIGIVRIVLPGRVGLKLLAEGGEGQKEDSGEDDGLSLIHI